MIVQRDLKIPLVLAHVGPLLLTLLAYDVGVTLLYMVGGLQWLSMPNLPLPLLGSAIALVVSLRNNLAYARWWEARTLWGAVVNDSRSFVRGLLMMVDDPQARLEIAQLQMVYGQALRCHLLRLPPWDGLAAHLPEATVNRLRTATNVPLALQVVMAERLAAAHKAGSLDSIKLAALHVTLSQLANAQGGLERIKNTPLPRQYNQFPQVFTGVFCVLLPLGIVHDLGYFTPFGSALLGFMFLALDRIGRDLEDPFEGTVHDVPMQAIARTIEIDLRQMVGASPTEGAIPIEDGVLR